MNQQNKPAAALRYTSDGALAECPCCGSLDIGGAHDTVHCYGCGLSITKPRPLQNAIDAWNRRSPKASAVPEQSRQQLHIMEHDDGRIAWYFDCDGHYIDVEKDDAGKYSVYFRDRTINAEAWLDQAEEAQAMHAANCTTQLESFMRGPCDCDAAPERVQPSITEDPDFRQWAAKFRTEANGGPAYEGLWKLIDAKLTQARHYAWCEDVNIDGLREHNAELVARATATEEKLASIRAALDKK